MTRRNWSIVCGAIAAAVAASWWIAARNPEAPIAAGSAHPLKRSIGLEPGAAETQRTNSPRAGEDASGRSPDGAAPRRPPASGFEQRNALYVRAAQASEDELMEMIEDARSIANQVERIPALETLLLKLAERDVAAAVGAAIEGKRADAYALIATLATADPETVWRAVAQMGDPLARTEYQGAVASVWLAHDPARAFATVVSLPAGWSREQLLRQSAWALARRDPQQAIELVRTLPNSERRELYSAVVQQWSRHDPAAAAEWIEAQDVQMQGALAFQIANAYVAQQPEEALAWALRISRSPGRNLWSHMIGQIAIYDPQDALRRAQAAENPAQRAQALGRAIASIAARDPQLATAYLDKLPPGNVRSNAVAEVARQVAQSRPHSAVDWLRDLPDAGMRMAAVNAVASQLAQNDVNAAAQMIDRVPAWSRCARPRQRSNIFRTLMTTECACKQPPSSPARGDRRIRQARANGRPRSPPARCAMPHSRSSFPTCRRSRSASRCWSRFNRPSGASQQLDTMTKSGTRFRGNLIGY